MSFLKDSGDVFSALFEKIPGGALFITLDGKITDVNYHFLQWSGYEQSELMYTHITDYIMPGKSAKPFESLEKLTPERGMLDFDTEFILKNRNVIRLKVRCHLTSYAYGYAEVLLTCYDIHGFYYMAEAVEKRDVKLYQQIMESSPDAILVFSATGKLIEVNKAFLNLTGYSEERLKNLKYKDLLSARKMPAYDPDGFAHELFNNYLKTADGELCPVQMHIYRGAEIDDVETFTVFCSTMKEYYRLADYFRKERRIMKKILSALTNQEETGVIIYRPNSGFVYANDLVYEKSGYTKKEFAKLLYRDIVHPEDFDSTLTKWGEILNRDIKEYSTEVRLLKKDGTIIDAAINISKQSDSSGVELIILKIDKMVETTEKIKIQKDENILKILPEIEGSDSSAILIGQPGGGVTYVNPLCCKTFGYTQKEMENLRGSEIIHPEYFTTNLKNVLQVYIGLKSKLQTKGKFIKKDGGEIIADVTFIKHKMNKNSYISMQFDNIRELAPAGS